LVVRTLGRGEAWAIHLFPVGSSIVGRASRDKGQRGERDFRDLLRKYGWNCDRDGSKAGDLKGDLPEGFHFEVKFSETLKVPTWVGQANEDAKEGDVPVVAFRRSNVGGDILGRWHIIEPAESWLQRLRG
jgi:hypothetical protein